MSSFAPGAIVEIKTPGGLAYVQVTHRHPSYPEVVRALPGPHSSRPADPAALATEQAIFTTMIPLERALARLGVEAQVVGQAEIPQGDGSFPTFRMPVRNKQGQIAYWWFWDGDGLSYDVELAEGQEKLPMREVMSAERFLARLTRAEEAA